MADLGGRYEMGAAIFQVRTETNHDGFFSRIFPSIIGLKHSLRARRKFRAINRYADQKVYVCLDPKWIEIAEEDLDAWQDYDESRIQAEIERIRALHGATPTNNQGEPE